MDVTCRSIGAGPYPSYVSTYGPGGEMPCVARQGVQCWLQDLASDLRLEEVLDRTIENAVLACPGRDFALLIVEDELKVVRSSGLRPGARRRIEDWARSDNKVLVKRQEQDDMLALPLLFKGRSLGLVVGIAGEGGEFDEEEREILTAFSEQAAVALANAHLFQTLLEN